MRRTIKLFILLAYFQNLLISSLALVKFARNDHSRVTGTTLVLRPSRARKTTQLDKFLLQTCLNHRTWKTFDQVAGDYHDIAALLLHVHQLQHKAWADNTHVGDLPFPGQCILFTTEQSHDILLLSKWVAYTAT